MKKKLLIVLLLLVCFWHINVKAENETPEIITSDPEVAEIEKEKEEEKEKPIVVKAEATRGEADANEGEIELDPEAEAELHRESGHRACVYMIREYDGKNIGSACDGSSKTFPTSQYSLLNDYSDGGTKYVFNGWYDADGQLLTTEKKLKIQAPVATDKCILEYVYAKFDKLEAPKIKFTYTDSVSTGSGSWSNTNGSSSAYTHIFRKPDEPNHYQFLYWKLDDIEYKDGDKYKFSFSGMQYGEEKEFEANAYWKADVTLDLYDENKKLISSESNFESVSISSDLNMDKVGFKFLGWFDADNNKVTDTTFYPNEMGTKPEPVQVTLYAKYEEIKTSVKVTKVWDDSDNESGKRPESVTVTLVQDEEDIDSIELSEENEWTHTFTDLPAYSDGEEITYTVRENEIANGYEVAYEEVEGGYVIHNALGQGGGEPDTPHNNPQTGDNIGLYLTTMIIGLSGLIICVKKYRFE